MCYKVLSNSQRHKWRSLEADKRATTQLWNEPFKDEVWYGTIGGYLWTFRWSPCLRTSSMISDSCNSKQRLPILLGTLIRLFTCIFLFTDNSRCLENTISLLTLSLKPVKYVYQRLMFTNLVPALQKAYLHAYRTNFGGKQPQVIIRTIWNKRVIHFA